MGAATSTGRKASRMAPRRWPGRPAHVLRPGAPIRGGSPGAKAFLDVAQRCGVRQNVSLAGPWLALLILGRSVTGPLHRGCLAVAARSLGHLSCSDLPRTDGYFLGRPDAAERRGMEHVGRRGQALHHLQGAENPAAIEALVTYVARLLHPDGYVPLRRGHPGLPHRMRSGGGLDPRHPRACAAAGAGVRCDGWRRATITIRRRPRLGKADGEVEDFYAKVAWSGDARRPGVS